MVSALVLYLASWLGLLPLIQVAHLTLADHDHRYCEIHHQIEDVPRANAGQHLDLPVATGLFATSAAALESAAGMPPQSHAPCLVLNHVTYKDPALIDGRSLFDTAGAQVDHQARWQSAMFVPCPLLLSAPKTSPPGLAA